MRRRRRVLDYTQQQLADRIHVSRSLICLIEQGRARITKKVGERIARVLRIEKELVMRHPNV